MAPNAPLLPNPELANLPDLPLIENAEIRERVFTHRSYFARSTALFQDPDDEPSKDNERLEFLGDSILSTVTATLMHRKFPLLRVGPASKVRSLVISNEILASICKYYRLQDSLRGAVAQTMSLKTSAQVQADLVESYIAGVYLDKANNGGGNENVDEGFKAVYDWLGNVLPPYIEAAINVVRQEHLLNRKSPPPYAEDGEIPGPTASSSSADLGSTVDPGTLSYFNQWCQQRHKKLTWEEKSEGGTKATPLWSMTAFVAGKKQGTGVSTNKKMAKVLAAKDSMKRMGIKIE